MIASSITAVFLLPLFSLWKREVVRFFRQPSRVIGALGTPLIFWFFIGSGFGNSFRSGSGPANQGYLEYFFPGSILMVLLFTSIFSNISLIEERREGFLLGVLVAPLSRLSLVLGKILGVTTLAVLQGSVFLLLAPLLGVSLNFFQLSFVWSVMLLISLLLSSLSFAFAWQLDSIQGFHAVMNMVLVPMWILSGALFPFSGASSWVRLLMVVNPLTYGMTALRQSLYLSQLHPGASEICSLPWAVGITMAFASGFIFVSCLLANRKKI
jgi:ABC-2 type transport system permease protein